jgi:hypothetical protein
VAEYYGDVDWFVPHSGGDCALNEFNALLPPRQGAARQICHALHRLPFNSTNASFLLRSTLIQIARTPAEIVRRLSMRPIGNVSQPFLCAKPNQDTAVFCLVDCEQVPGFLVGEYLALVDEVIITIISYTSDSCRCPCQVGQCKVFLVGVVGVMINLLKCFYFLEFLQIYLFAYLLNRN